MKRGWNNWLILSVVGVMAFAACGGDDDDDEATATTAAPTTAAAPEERPAVTIHTSEYAFDAPDTFPAGYVDLTLVNDGEEDHHAQIVRVPDDMTWDEFTAAAEASDVEALGAKGFVGGPNGEVTTTAYLEPGTYALLCVIPDEEGIAHVAKGMLKKIEVEGDELGAEPAADHEVVLDDFSFTFPEDYDGRGTIKISNEGKQVHELFMLQMGEGKTLDDMNAFLLAPPDAPPPEGPPPFGALNGGIVGISPGEHAWLEYDLEPGNYAVYCFFPNTDSPEQLPHALDGMITQVTIT